MKTKRIERLMAIPLLLTLAACIVRSAPTPVASSIVSPPTASSTIVPIVITPALSATLAPGQPTEYLEFSDLAEAEAATTFPLWIPAFIPDDLGLYRAWVSKYADGSENVRILYVEPGAPRDASLKTLDLQITRTAEVISRETITRQLKVNALDIREVQVRGQTGFSYWIQSGAAGNSSILTWREGMFNIRLSLFGDWPQPDNVNPHRLDDLLIKIAESLQAAFLTPRPTIAPAVMPPVSPTATPECQPAAGVAIDVRRVSDTTAVLHARGLQPGEIPFIFYSTSIIGHSMRGEASGFAKGADEQGEFSFELTGLQPLEGQARATWDIRLVHRRGVACAAITLP